MSDLEERLRAELTTAAEQAPAVPDLAARVSARHRRRMRSRRALLGTATVAVALALTAALVAGREPPNPRIVTRDPAAATTTIDADGRVAPPPGDISPSTTTVAAVPMPGLVGLEYRAAVERLTAQGLNPVTAPVRLSFDDANGVATGIVTRTTPPGGGAVDAGASVVVYVAVDGFDLGFPRDGSPFRQPNGDSRVVVGSNIYFPPVGLRAGLADMPAPECAPPNAPKAGRAVRFINGELVGCMFNMFVWLDRLPQLWVPLGTMPDITGLSVREATERLRANGIENAGFSMSFSGSLPPNLDRPDFSNMKITGSTPAAGQPVLPLDDIRLELVSP